MVAAVWEIKTIANRLALRVCYFYEMNTWYLLSEIQFMCSVYNIILTSPTYLWYHSSSRLIIFTSLSLIMLLSCTENMTGLHRRVNGWIVHIPINLERLCWAHPWNLCCNAILALLCSKICYWAASISQLYHPHHVPLQERSTKHPLLSTRWVEAIGYWKKLYELKYHLPARYLPYDCNDNNWSPRWPSVTTPPRKGSPLLPPPVSVCCMQRPNRYTHALLCCFRYRYYHPLAPLFWHMPHYVQIKLSRMRSCSYVQYRLTSEIHRRLKILPPVIT